MKETTLIAILFATSIACFGQEDQKQPSTAIQACDTVVYTMVETMPEYEGGIKALEKDLKKSLKSEHEIDDLARGTLYLTFIINCNGQAEDFKALRGLDKSTDESVISVLQSFQNWTAGAHGGVNVNCMVNLAIRFDYGKISSFSCVTCDVAPSLLEK